MGDLNEEVVPSGEGETAPVSIRVPKRLLEEIDRCAKETNNSRTDAMLHLWRWALVQYKAGKTKKKGTG